MAKFVKWKRVPDRPWLGVLLLIGLIHLITFVYCQKMYDATNRYRLQLTNSNSAAELAGEIREQLGDRSAASPLTFFRAGKAFTDRHPGTDPYILDAKGNILYSLSAYSRQNADVVPLDPIRQYLRDNSLTDGPIYGFDPFLTSSRLQVFSAAPLSLPGFNGYVYVVLENRMLRLTGIPWQERLHRRSVPKLLLFSVAILFSILYCFHRDFRYRLSRLLHLVRNVAPETPALATAVPSLDTYERTIVESLVNISKTQAALQGREQTIKDVISRVAHDSRTPLFLIQDYAERLLTNELALPEQKREAERIRRNVKSLLTLLADLDEFDSIRDGHLPFEPDVCHLDEFANDLISVYGAAAEKRNIELRVVSPDTLSPVLASIPHLERVMRNLIDNALRHTSPGGSIELRLTPQPGDRARVALIDTGCGIPAEELPHIFKPFHQVCRENRANGSSGIGLAIVDQILKAHGSQIFVESKEGMGTTFWFDLPNYRQTPVL